MCFELTVSDIEPTTAAHIISPPASPARSSCHLCRPPVARRAAAWRAWAAINKAIVQNPDAYYVNVHNAPHPAGALRGQLGGCVSQHMLPKSGAGSTKRPAPLFCSTTAAAHSQPRPSSKIQRFVLRQPAAVAEPIKIIMSPIAQTCIARTNDRLRAATPACRAMSLSSRRSGRCERFAGRAARREELPRRAPLNQAVLVLIALDPATIASRGLDQRRPRISHGGGGGGGFFFFFFFFFEGLGQG